MIKSLGLSNFTVFSDAQFNFGKNLNVLVGVNGTGKTHVLKLLYSIVNASTFDAHDGLSQDLTKTYFQSELARKLSAVFRPDRLGRLVHKEQGRLRCEVRCQYQQAENDISFSFHTSSKSEVTVNEMPTAWVEKVPVYMPTRELLTIFPNFVSLYETSHLPFEETWRDTCVLLGKYLVRGPKEQQIKLLLEPLQNAMNGRVQLESSRFYLISNGDKTEIQLVAEGLRKLAMIAMLIANGSLTDKGFLFWDEPESNLNPEIVREIASTILRLGRSGIQIFIATHSLFLLRELDILLNSSEYKDIDPMFFGLNRGGNGIDVSESSTLDGIGDIASLDEELNQNDRYLEMAQS